MSFAAQPCSSATKVRLHRHQFLVQAPVSFFMGPKSFQACMQWLQSSHAPFACQLHWHCCCDHVALMAQFCHSGNPLFCLWFHDRSHSAALKALSIAHLPLHCSCGMSSFVCINVELMTESSESCINSGQFSMHTMIFQSGAQTNAFVMQWTLLTIAKWFLSCGVFSLLWQSFQTITTLVKILWNRAAFFNCSLSFRFLSALGHFGVESSCCDSVCSKTCFESCKHNPQDIFTKKNAADNGQCTLSHE